MQYSDSFNKYVILPDAQIYVVIYLLLVAYVNKMEDVLQMLSLT